MSFDRDAALHQAMLLFWRHGYEATPLSGLTTAMGVTAPSIYAAFGDKKALFRAAMRRYLGDPDATARFIGDALSARDAADGMLRAAAVRYTGENTPPGCLLASAAISCSPEAADVQGELAEIRQDIEDLLRRRIARDVGDGALPAGTDADALAAYVMSVIQGMSTLARDGAPREKLLRVADAAMRAWPHVDGRPGGNG